LQLYDADPEFAFLSLVNAGEVLASGLQLGDDDLYDDELKELLVEIEVKAGQETAQKLKKRLFQVRRKFTCGLARLLNTAFFEGSESAQDFFRLKPDNIEKHLKAAYDLRSRFLHVGTRFGNWVSVSHEGAEVMIGEPAYGDPDWKRLISRIPTLGGLERIIRFCLLRFMHQRISILHPLLD